MQLDLLSYVQNPYEQGKAVVVANTPYGRVEHWVPFHVARRYQRVAIVLDADRRIVASFFSFLTSTPDVLVKVDRRYLKRGSGYSVEIYCVEVSRE